MDEEALARQYTPLVKKLARRFCLGRHDVYQEYVSIAYVGLLRAVRTYQADRGTVFITWAYRLIWQALHRQMMLDKNRKKNLPTEPLFTDEVVSTDGESGAYLCLIIEAAERFLRPRELVVFREAVMGGRKNHEVASDLGISRQAVQQIRCRMMDGIRSRVRSALGVEATAAGRSGGK